MGLEKLAQSAHSSPARQRRNRWRATLHRLKTLVARTIREPVGEDVTSKPEQTRDIPTVTNRGCAAQSFLQALESLVASSRLNVASYIREWQNALPKAPGTRLRALFPVPPVREWPDEVHHSFEDVGVVLKVSNFCLGALNCLQTGMKACLGHAAMNKSPSAAQKATQTHVCRMTACLLQRLKEELGPSLPWRGSFAACEPGSFASYEHIRAQAVDLPAKAATCNASKLVGDELRAQIQFATEVFPAGPSTTLEQGIPLSQRAEYIALTVRELRCGKLKLRQEIAGIGGVFAAAKSGGRQRKIWNGAGLSQVAARPPRPRRLASPASFLDMEVEPGQRIYFSKRDASTYFDILQVPEALQPYFGQPPVTVKELVLGGMSIDEVWEACQDVQRDDFCGDCCVYPVYAVWPMGFSWSSAVAQDTTLAVCKAAGIPEEQILSVDHDTPSCHDEVCLVATDDTVLVHKNPEQGAKRLENLDKAFEEHCVPRNPAKDVSLAEKLPALGCDLSNSPAAAQPSRSKLCACICRTLDLLTEEIASPVGLNSSLGVWEWFALLQRGFFSIYDAVYAFVRREPPTEKINVPPAVLNEMLVTLLLAPLLTTQLDRQPLPQLVAADAAPEFGFGVAVCGCTQAEAATVCRLAERRGDYVRLTAEEGDDAYVSRLGKPRQLRYTQRNFKTVISEQARWMAHSGVLEAHAFLLALKWICRHAKKHGHKVPFLIDAKVVVGAITKGRSSARSLRTCLRSAAAHVMAANLLPRLIYIPSESNPADRPSRGRRQRPPANRPVRSSIGKQKFRM
ncbi:unnamed protein product [Symbiodinium sp. CCMP2592]|nr:unnamed protein product [Symbiodinium sp. CCMP2592]